MERADQLSMIRETFQLNMSKSARFGELNVGAVVETLKLQGFDVAFVHCPICDVEGRPVDPSHSEIVNLPPTGSPDSALVGYLIAKCVSCLHLAKY